MSLKNDSVKSFLVSCLSCFLILATTQVSLATQGENSPAATTKTVSVDDDFDGQSLIQAARDGDLAKIKSALAAGVDVDSATEYGATALFFACDRGYLEVVESLLKNGADPNIKDTFYKATPITWAQSKGHKEIIVRLLKNGAKGADAALLRAITRKEVEFAKMILESGAVSKPGLVSARDAALKIKDEKIQSKMLNLFAGIELPAPLQAGAKATEKKKQPPAKADEEDKREESKFGPSSAQSRKADLAISSPNWPGFRGTGARGIADGQNPPVQWHVQGEQDEQANENLKWKSAVPGLGLSCPTIWGDDVYLTTAVAEDDNGDEQGLKIGLYGDVDSVEDDRTYEFRLLCFSKTDGSLKWERTANKGQPAVKRHAKSSHANPTVATDGKHVVAFFGSEGLYCYSSTGQLRWKKDLGFLDSGWFYDPGYQWGFGSSPLIYKDRVVVQCDIQGQSFVAAFDLQTGDELWRTERDEIPTWSTPTVFEFGEMAMLITGGTKSARGYDVVDGRQLWSLKGFSEIVVPTPFVAHDLIFVASGYSPIQPIYAIKPEARGDISLEDNANTNESIQWSVKRGGPYMPSPIVYGDYLYPCSNSGILACYVATTGVQVYKKRLKAPGGSLSFTASPLAADGHLFLPAEDGRVLVVKAGAEFNLVHTNDCGESILATPAISAGVMLIRTQDSLIALEKVN